MLNFVQPNGDTVWVAVAHIVSFQRSTNPEECQVITTRADVRYVAMESPDSAHQRFVEYLEGSART